MEQRKIIHVDMDAFYASVEQHDRPELRGRPIVVGGSEPRSVVCAASYEARAYGVRSAMAGSKARRLCPTLVFVTPRFDRYKEISRAVHQIFSRYTELIEPISLDEAFLDVTELCRGGCWASDVACEIRSCIREELGLSASAGISYNKFLAKIASEQRKPNGQYTIHPMRAQALLDTLPIEAFWGVGRVTASRMHMLGIHTGKELRAQSLEWLIGHWGGKMGRIYYDFARGVDDRPVEPHYERKSLGCEHTFETDVSELGELGEYLRAVAEELVRRRDRYGFEAYTLTLKVKLADFQTLSRSSTSLEVLQTFPQILELGHRLLRVVALEGRAVRLLGLSLSRGRREDRGVWYQPCFPFFDDE